MVRLTVAASAGSGNKALVIPVARSREPRIYITRRMSSATLSAPITITASFLSAPDVANQHQDQDDEHDRIDVGDERALHLQPAPRRQRARRVALHRERTRLASAATARAARLRCLPALRPRRLRQSDQNGCALAARPCRVSYSTALLSARPRARSLVAARGRLVASAPLQRCPLAARAAGRGKRPSDQSDDQRDKNRTPLQSQSCARAPPLRARLLTSWQAARPPPPRAPLCPSTARWRALPATLPPGARPAGHGGQARRLRPAWLAACAACAAGLSSQELGARRHRRDRARGALAAATRDGPGRQGGARRLAGGLATRRPAPGGQGMEMGNIKSWPRQGARQADL